MGHVVQIKLETPPEGWPDSADESPLRFQCADGSFFLTDEELLDAQRMGCRFQVVRRIQERELPVRFSLPHDGAVTDWPPEDARLAVLARLLAEERATGAVEVRFLGRNRIVPADGFALDRAGGQRRYVWQVVPTEIHAARPAVQERFRTLREVCADPNARVVLSLGSGGLKLFAHATALRLFDALGIGEHFSEVWGSSAGAMAGLLYAQGLSPHAIEQMGYDLYTGRVDLELRPSKLQFLRHLVRDALLPSLGAAGAGFVDCAAGLSRMLERYCGDAEPRLPFYCIAFNLRDCQPDVLTPGIVPPHLAELMVQAEARAAALASSSVPLLFVPRIIRRISEDAHYIDGSTTEDVPLHSVVRKWDLDREYGGETRERLVIVYVKLTGGLETYRTHPGRIGKLRLMQTVAAAGIETMHRRDVELLRMRKDVRLLGLELGDSSPDFFDTRRIAEFIRSAKECFPEQLVALEERLRAESGATSPPSTILLRVYPVLFTIFGFPISTFGIMVGLAFLAGGWLTARSFEKLGHPGSVAWDLLTWCVVGGFLGAKLWWFAEEVARNPNAGLATLLSVEGLRGGLTWYGGFFGGALGGILASRSYGLPVLDTLNAGAPALAASHAIGRIGCFLVGDDYGKPSDVPWAIAFPNGTPPTTERVHPTMLYETFWLIPVFAWLWHRRGRSPFLFGEWLVLSGIGRLWIEHLRINPPALGPFSNAQLVALACIAAGVASWLWFYTRPAPVSSRAAK